MAVEVGAGGGEAGDVVSEAMIRVGQSSVKVGHPVEGLVGHVPLVGFGYQSTSQSKCHFGFEKPGIFINYESNKQRLTGELT